MRGIRLAGCLGVLFVQQLCAQTVVLVSPSTQAQHSLACSTDSLHSFEELHFVAVAHYLADRLCAHPQVEGTVGLWQGQAENSGMIDGCPRDRARELGALLGKYYHQKAALVFERNAAGKASLLSFHSPQSLPVISRAMTRATVKGATVVPHPRDNLILMVVTDDEQRARAHGLYSLLKGRDLREEAGNAELVGGKDRARARSTYDELLGHAPADVQQLEHAMYSEQFSDLGIDTPSQ